MTLSKSCNWLHKIETCIYINVIVYNINNINKRHCILCNRHVIGDEFHMMLKCETIRDQGSVFLPRYFIKHICTLKFSVLLSSYSLNKLIRICRFIKIIIGLFNLT